MSKRTVLKVIAGVGVVGVVAAIVHRSNRKVRYANLAVKEAAQLVEEAAKTGYIKEEDKAVLAEWRKSPSTWKQD